MNKIKTSVRIVVGCALGMVGLAGASEYIWMAGNGDWNTSANWSPNGVPSGDDLAAFPASAPWTVQVKEDVSLFRMNSDAAQAAGTLSFAVDPGVTLSVDQMRVRASAPMAFGVTGGGTLAITNLPFCVGGHALAPVTFTVAGGSTFLMPKPAGSGLYVGRLDARGSTENLLHVTGGSSAIISNAVCIGQSCNVDNTTQKLEGPAHIIVDDGSFFYGGAVVFVGRGASGSTLAVTNATVSADRISCGTFGWYNSFGGSNAVVRTPLVSLPDDTCAGVSNRLAFVDSELNVPDMRLSAGGRGNQAEFRDCRTTARTLRVGFSDGWSGRALFAGGTLDCKEIYCGYVPDGLLRTTSNNVLRVEGTAVICTNKVYAGHAPRSVDDCYEQVGGSLRAEQVVAGNDGSRRASVRLRGVDLVVNSFLLSGDTSYSTNGPAIAPSMELADMTVRLPCICAGTASLDALLCFSNSTVFVTNQWNSALIGARTGARRNELRLVDSTFTMNSTSAGGNVFIGGDGGIATLTNTLRLVRSTFNYNALALNKGDVILGYNADSCGNRVVMEEGSVFNYDRKWMAVGQSGKDNVWELHGGSKLEAAGSYLVFGNVSSATGNGLLLDTGSSVNVMFLELRGTGSWLDVRGTGNVIRASSTFSAVSGCSFTFRPNADSAGGVPMLTTDRALPYSSTAPIRVDLAEAPIGQHMLVSSAAALAAPVKNENYTILNLPKRLSAQVRLSADNRTLWCSVAPTGTIMIFR